MTNLLFDRYLIVFLLFSFISCSIKNDNCVRYHKYTPTASSWNILNWNTKDSQKKLWILKETIDEKGRVSELVFLKNGSIIKDQICYLANRVKYQYKEGIIIETLYHDQNELVATDCEMHFKTIYHLNNEKDITKIERFSKYNFDGLDQIEIKKQKDLMPEYVVELPDSNQLQVEYYYHSYAKLNGVYPVSSNYILDNKHYYYGNEPERTAIEKGLKKSQ